MCNTIYLLSILTHIVYFLPFSSCFMEQPSSTSVFPVIGTLTEKEKLPTRCSLALYAQYQVV